ncbi:MAG: polymer-forming cytoskeletal protein [Candidatus Hydrogenedentes bacterium]|nr:polymer-forming cytoskeletal protein [Candidatus Hydrogenedentota bacterium]
MTDKENLEQTKKPLDLNLDELTKGKGDGGIPDDGDLGGGDTFEDLERASKKGTIFGRFNAAFHDVLQTSRGPNRMREPAVEAGDSPHVTADDLAIRRAKTVTSKRMVVPEGAIINGSMMSGSESEIGGRIEGDVTVDGRLLLGSSALVTGNVRATSCKVEGLVEGKMECTQELELSATGRLNADAIAGKKMVLCGQVFGNVSTGGMLHIMASAKVTGDIRARQIIIEEGAVFNGRCLMRPPAQRSEK